MMFNNKYTIPIKKGDIVGIAHDNYIQLGIYIGRGKTGSLQYYSIWGLSERERVDSHSKMNRYEKAYINTSLDNKVNVSAFNAAIGNRQLHSDKDNNFSVCSKTQVYCETAADCICSEWVLNHCNWHSHKLYENFEV